MRTIKVKLYTFDELSDKAKETAREWFRECESQFFGSHGEIWEPAETAAKLLGITFADRSVSLYGGGTRIEPDIRYSGFSSQGDGASFVGSYAYHKGSSKAVRAEFGGDSTSTLELYRIADELTELQKKLRYRLTADITQDGRYVHEQTMSLEVTGPEHLSDSKSETFASEVETELLELMRAFARWIYRGLMEEYDYQLEDAQVDGAILANEYEFTENGKRA